MIGTTLAHYRITAALGAGGMGEVWRAHDEKLGREVALKVLPEEFSDDPQRLERFEREARAVASLNHPHIVTIFSVEDANGVRFLTMELVDGRTLDQMTPDKGFDIETFFDLATPLAEAISAAHDKSVVHRDLKPANVMVDFHGRVKVMDFGLAKLQAAGDPSDSSELPTEALTGVGMIVGTVPYMSPEQIEGRIVDHRTDIFSLGVMLYEMALGDRPFQGTSSPALMSSILKDVPKPVVEIRADLPRHLGRIIGRCLEKDRRDRYQTARDVFIELKALRQESSSLVSPEPRVESGSARTIQRVSSSSADGMRADKPWIVVMPFSCRGNDPDLETFADGLEEDITAGLSRFSHLSVIASGSTTQTRDRSVDFRRLADELGARFVIQGRIRAAAGTIRVSVQVVDAVTDAHLWSETYDRSLDGAGIFEVQDEVTDTVVATIADSGGVLVRSINDLMRSKSPEEYTATDWVMRTFAYWGQLREDDHAELRNGLELAVEREPHRSAIWACLAQTYLDEHRIGFNPRENPLERALDAAFKAVELDPRDSLAQESLADTHFFRRDLTSFRLAADKALAINPRDATTMASMGMWLAFSGELERGSELAVRAMELNPEHGGWYHMAPFIHHFSERRYDQALESAKYMNMPDFFWSHMMVAAAAGKLGLEKDARSAVGRLEALFTDPDRDLIHETKKFILPEDLLADFLDGIQKAGLKIDGAGGEAADPGPAPKPNATLSSGAVAIAVLPFTEDPGYDPLRSDPQFTSFVERLGLPPSRKRTDSPSDDEPSPEKSIAVLPFVNMSADPENEYFSDGLSEEIINALTRLPGLRVIARTSAFRFRGEQDLRMVGEALGVDTLLEGSVRKADQKLRITAQLIDVADDSHIWSERFDRDLVDVFAIQDEISAAIVDKLHLSLGDGEPASRERTDVAALDALLEARHFFFQFTPAAAEQSLTCIQKALSIEPDYPDALAMQVFYNVMMGYMFADPREVLPQARSLAERALELDPYHGEAQAAVAILAGWMDRDWSEGERHYRRALELAPGSARVHELHGLGSLLAIGRLEEALSELDRAVELDPLSALYAGNRGRVLTCSRRFVEAEATCRRGLALDPGQLLAQVELIYALTFQGRFEEAAAIGRRAIADHGPAKAPLNALALSLALAGERDEAWQLLDAADEQSSGAYQSPLPRALVHAVCSEMDEAIECAQRAIDEFEPLMWYIKVHPMFDALRDDLRYPDLLQQMNLHEGN